MKADQEARRREATRADRAAHGTAPIPTPTTCPDAPTPRDACAPNPRPASVPPEDIDLTPGALLADHYRLGRTLGRGGMGVVVLAHDEQLDREVAIKAIRPELLGNRVARDDFLREARAMARVRHLNVVDVDYFGVRGRAPYFVMEYVPGTTVDRWFKERTQERGDLPHVDEALGLIYQCCRGVSAIHQAGAIHGDLKPNNLLLGAGLRLVITDLGLARMLDGGNLEAVAGTPAYMAPEAHDPTDDAEIAKRRDVYSLGVLAYELLTGQRPYVIPNAEAFHTLERDTPTAPSRLRPDLPAAFDAPLLSALEVDPQKRTPTADAFRRDLARARRQGGMGSREVQLLVVDDDRAFLTMARTVLHANFPAAEIVTLTDGADALEVAEHQSFDLVITDLRMPETNGVAVTAALRASDPHHRTAILVVTAEGGARDWQLLRSLGADGFLTKPFDPEALVSEVGRLLQARGRRQAAS